MNNQDLIVVRNALVVPPACGPGQPYARRSGVFAEDGTFIDASLSIANGAPRHAAPVMPDLTAGAVDHIPGVHVFGGIFFGHFGHFITESTGRLWPAGQPYFAAESFVFVPKEAAPNPSAIVGQTRLLAAMGVHVDLQVVARPTRVETLVIPRQEFGLDADLVTGSHRYRTFMREAVQAGAPAQGSDRLYISRRGLKWDRGTILGEPLIEEWLEAEGYRLFRPQMHSPDEQIAQYRAAKQIISVDCSPLHLLAYVARPDQMVSMILRRPASLTHLITAHLKGFSGVRLQIIDTLIANHVHEKMPRPGRSSWGEAGLAAIGQQLATQGMIAHPEVWRDLSPDEIAAQLAEIQTQASARFIRKPYDPAPAAPADTQPPYS